MMSSIQVNQADEIEVILATKQDMDLDLAGLDIEEGISMVRVIHSIKQHLQSGFHLTLRQPPQMMAHNLYRIGLLNHPLLHLESVRMEESSAS